MGEFFFLGGGIGGAQVHLFLSSLRRGRDDHLWTESIDIYN